MSEYPPWWKQLKNVSEYGLKLMHHAVTHGMEIYADEEVIEKRKGICLGCEKYDPEQIRCKACGCWLEKKWKLALDECELEKWGEEVNEEKLKEDYKEEFGNLKKFE